MYGYEPSWLDIYMNAMANQSQMMPLTSINTQMPVIPIEQTIPQNVQQPDQNIMVGNEQNINPMPAILTLIIVGSMLFYRPDSWLFAPFFAFMLFGLVNSLFPAK